MSVDREAAQRLGTEMVASPCREGAEHLAPTMILLQDGRHCTPPAKAVGDSAAETAEVR